MPINSFLSREIMPQTSVVRTNDILVDGARAAIFATTWLIGTIRLILRRPLCNEAFGVLKP